MQALRSKFLTLVLTIFVGLGLASSAMAHPLPTRAETQAGQTLQALRAMGLPLGALCGPSQGKTSCPDDTCPICPGGAALSGASFTPPVPGLVRFHYVLALPSDTPMPVVRLLLGHDAQAPPAGLI